MFEKIKNIFKNKQIFNYNNLIINLIVPGPGPNPEPKKNDKQVGSWFKKAYEQMEKEYIASAKDDCRIYIILVRTINWKNDEQLVLEVKKLVKNELNNYEFVIIETMNNVNFDKSKNITNLINKILDNDIFYYTNSSLIICGHSDGYFLFTDKKIDKSLALEDSKDLDQTNILKIYNKLVNITNTIISRNPKVNEVLADKTITKIPAITPNTLQLGIKNSKLKNLDLLIMCSCNIQNLDVIYTLSSCAKYIVGSEQSISIEPNIFKNVISNKKKIDFQFVNDLVDSSYSTHKELEDKTGISSIEINSKFYEFKTNLNELISFLTSNYTSFRSVLKTARENIDYVSSGEDFKYYIDLFYWLKCLRNELSSTKKNLILIELIEKIFLKKSNFIYMNELYKDFYTFGLTIYYPKNKIDYKNTDNNSYIYCPENSLLKSQFSETTKWKLFLKKQFE